jgi:phosphate:Na+ symporter
MLGADVGTSVMAVVFSLDLSWLSPLFIFVGVVLFIRARTHRRGPRGPGADRPGLMLLALRLITESTTVLTQSPTVRTLLVR